MGLVSTWLNGIGLDHAIPSFTAAGIVTPAALAELDMAYYEALGVTDPQDRRKLFYLVQRIKVAVAKEANHGDAGGAKSENLEDQVDSLVLSTTRDQSLLNLQPSDESDGRPEGNEDRRYQQQQAGLSSRRGKNKLVSSNSEIVDSSPLQESQKMPNFASSPKKGSVTGQQASKIQVPERRKIQSPKTRALSNGTIQPPSTSKPTSLSPKRSASVAPVVSASVAVQQEEKVTPEKEYDIDEEIERMQKEEAERAAVAASRTSNVPATRRSERLKNKAEPNMATPLDQQSKRLHQTSKLTSGNIQHKSNGQIPSKSGRVTAASSTTTRGTVKKVDKSPAASLRHSVQKSGMQTPRSRLGGVSDSKIQNPSKSVRTGKQLSTIPSNSIAPMSPLITLPIEEMDKDVTNTISSKDVRQSKTNRITTRRRSASRESLPTGRMGSDSEDSRSDSDNSGRHRRRGTRRSSTNAPTTNKSETNSLLGSRRLSFGTEGESSKSSLNDTPLLKSKGSFQGSSDVGWKGQIARLREDTNDEFNLFRSDEDNLDDDDMGNDMRIRVAIRKRPSQNMDLDIIHPLDYDHYGRILVYQPKTRLDLTKEIDTAPFAFDNVFDETSSNFDIYDRAVRNLIPLILDGQWGSVFAYGQTGSGKTFTMMGSNFTTQHGGMDSIHKNHGLYYLAAVDLFDRLKNHPDLRVSFSLFEIYGGKLFDLLSSRKPVKCLEDSRGKVCFPGLSEHSIESPSQLIELIELGATCRSTGTTSRNADSSRSHAVMQLHLYKRVGRNKKAEFSRLTFIDLAGSERGADTASSSRATRLEGAEINTSLLALKEVIRARASGGAMTHVPFRGSKLTQVLKESFVGENSRCVMIGCISPDIGNCEQTMNTLRYADRVKERDAESGALPSLSMSSRGRRRASTLSRLPAPPILSTVPEPIRESSITPKSVIEEPVGSSSNDQQQYQQLQYNDSGFDDEVSFLTSELNIQKTQSSPQDGRTLDVPELKVEVVDSEGCVEAAVTTNSPFLTNDSAFDFQSTTEMVKAYVSENKSEESVEASTSESLVADLISTHRAAMSDMLNMIKEEMVLVNNVDSDRDGLDEYIVQLEKLQQNQLSLISDIRDRLTAYHLTSATRSSTKSKARQKSDGDEVMSDDSFEDLRF